MQEGLEVDGSGCIDIFNDNYLIAAAHELKSPLVLIRQLALSLDSDDLVVNQTYQRIILTAERALALTNDLTKSVRLADSLFDLETINPKELCESVAHELDPLFKARGKKLEVISHRQLLAVANRDLLRRAIVNLSVNALEYTVGASSILLKTNSINSGDRIRVSVRDFGPALSAGVWHQIMKNLGKSPQVVSGRPSSSGLGLLIASKFAEAMNGRLGAIKHQDGATFYIELMSSRQIQLL